MEPVNNEAAEVKTAAPAGDESEEGETSPDEGCRRCCFFRLRIEAADSFFRTGILTKLWSCTGRGDEAICQRSRLPGYKKR